MHFLRDGSNHFRRALHSFASCVRDRFRRPSGSLFYGARRLEAVFVRRLVAFFVFFTRAVLRGAKRNLPLWTKALTAIYPSLGVLNRPFGALGALAGLDLGYTSRVPQPRYRRNRKDGAQMVNGNAAVLKGGVPVTGTDAIEILENDHRVIKDLFSRLVTASEPSEQSLVLDKLKAILTVHNATEENLVYPALRVAASRAKDADALYHEQDEAKVGIWKLDAILTGSLKNEDFGKHAKELQEAVLAHVRKEEETEFPHLHESLKGKSLTQLTEAIREFRSKFTFEDASK